jgi:hypothetical protein
MNLVKITAPLAEGGTYAGELADFREGAIVGTGETCELLNVNEVGQNTHDLPAGKVVIASADGNGLLLTDTFAIAT